MDQPKEKMAKLELFVKQSDKNKWVATAKKEQKGLKAWVIKSLNQSCNNAENNQKEV